MQRTFKIPDIDRLIFRIPIPSQKRDLLPFQVLPIFKLYNVK